MGEQNCVRAQTQQYVRGVGAHLPPQGVQARAAGAQLDKIVFKAHRWVQRIERRQGIQPAGEDDYFMSSAGKGVSQFRTGSLSSAAQTRQGPEGHGNFHAPLCSSCCGGVVVSAARLPHIR